VPAFDIPDNPTDDEVSAAVEKLFYPFSLYRYETPATAKSLVLSAIFTGIMRPFIDKAPAYFVPSPQPGTGKGKLGRAVTWLAFATSPVIIQRGDREEEFEKRLPAVLMQSPPCLMIDNANGVAVNGDMIESTISEGIVHVRPFGKNTETIPVRCSGMLFINGVNTIITGDMSRRSIRIGILAKSPNPELDAFDFDPVQYVAEHRIELLPAAYTCMRAFRLAGMPKSGTPDPGSFDQWTRHVRDLVYWLTKQDVCDSFVQNKLADPKEQADIALLHALYNKYHGTKHGTFTANEVCMVYGVRGTPTPEVALVASVRDAIDKLEIGPLFRSALTPEKRLQQILNRLVDAKASLRQTTTALATNRTTRANNDLIDALEVKFFKQVNPMGFAAWARRRTGAYTGQYILRSRQDTTTRANFYSVEKTTGE
jgi:hypothetical protein